MQFLTANYHGPTLVDVIGGLGSRTTLEERLVDLRERDWRVQHDVDVILSHLQPDGTVRLSGFHHERPHSLSGPDPRGGSLCFRWP